MRRHGHKFNAQRTTLDGIVFASKAESQRYAELKLLEKAGEIHALKLQPKFPIVMRSVKVGTYIADFEYRRKDGGLVIEDVKSPATQKLSTYRLKKKLVEALYGISITEIGKVKKATRAGKAKR